MLAFLKFNDLEDGEIKLVLKSYDIPDVDKGYSPRYGFSIIHIEDNEEIGVVYFTVDTSRRQYLCGHLSYGVSPVYSGHNYAMKACKLIKRVALDVD
jgi:predicted acetyltransferase